MRTEPAERLWPSPWGFKQTDEPPPKEDIFHPFRERTNLDGIEDFLQHNAVFLNGLRNTPAHSDSYMTVVSFNNLQYCYELLRDTYHPTPDDWDILLTAWKSNPNTQRAIRLVVSHIEQQIKNEPESKNSRKRKAN